MTTLKRFLIVPILTAGHIMANAQGVAIGSGTPTPAASALLDLQSTTQGLLPPRMTTAQRTGIASPATGLVVYDTTVGALFVRTASAWVQLASGGGSSSWSLTGNAGTNSATNFIGTTDAQPLQFRVNNLTSGTVDATTRNTSLGAFTLAAGGTGNWNTAQGYEAMRFNTGGVYNAASGARALKANTTGSANVAVGMEALTSNTIGRGNVAVGASALQNSIAKSGNVAIGDSALYSNGIGAVDSQDAIGNVACGSKALFSNTTGQYNTALGYHAQQSNTSGYYNTAVGWEALANNTTAAYGNTVIGADALTSQMGNDNTALGYLCGPIAVNLATTTSIGVLSTPNADNKINIGYSANNNMVGVYGAVQNLSDGRFKLDVVEDVPGLAFITRLRPVTYHLDALKVDGFVGVKKKVEHMKDPKELERYTARAKEVSAEKLTGFIAQEVEQAAKEVGYDFDGVQHPKNDGDTYTLGYSTFVVPLVKAVQEQQAMIEEQKNTIAAQQQAIETLQEQVRQLMQR